MTFKNLNMKRTVHRLRIIRLTLDIHRGVHALFVKVQMTRGLPQLGTSNVGRENPLIAVLEMSVAAEIFYKHPDHGALRMPKDQASTDLFRYAEQIQLLTQLAVIALLGFFQLPE